MNIDISEIWSSTQDPISENPRLTAISLFLKSALHAILGDRCTVRKSTVKVLNFVHSEILLAIFEHLPYMYSTEIQQVLVNKN